MSVTKETMMEQLAEVYQFLGDLFLGEPGGPLDAFVVRAWEREPVLEFETTALPQPVRDSLSALEAYVQSLPVDDALAAALEIDAEHAMLFVGPKPPPLHPYESVYRDRLTAGGQTFDHLLMGESVDKVRSLWQRAGVEPFNPRNELPDHLGLELGFMAALLDMQQSADAEASRLGADLARELLDEHLLAWVPEFCADAKECDDARFFGLACEAVMQVLQAPASKEAVA